MFKFLKSALFCLLLSSVSNAQNVFTANTSGGGFNFTVGYQAFSPGSWYENYYSKDKLDTFNIGVGIESGTNPNRLSAAIYPQPKNGLYTVGFQGFGAFSSVMIGGELNARFGGIKGGTQEDIITPDNGGTATITSSTTTRFYNANAMLDIGYVAFRNRGFLLYPMVGVGYSATGVRFRSQSDTRAYPDIAQIVTEEDGNLQNIFVWTTGLGLDFGIGAQYFLGSSNEDKAKGFSLGLRTGYSLQPATNDIRINSKKAVDGKDMVNVNLPKLGNQGFYVKLLIGYGRMGE